MTEESLLEPIKEVAGEGAVLLNPNDILDLKEQRT
jgi:hypothetical protein